MTLLRVLAVLLLARVAAAQVTPPPACRGAVTDRLVFHTPTNGPVKFHLKFHAPAGTFDARAVVKLHRHGADPSCTEGDVLDYVIDQLISERNQFLPPQ